jgi:hypothetical protein
MYQNIDLKTNKKMYSVNLIHAIITELISKTDRSQFSFNRFL